MIAFEHLSRYDIYLFYQQSYCTSMYKGGGGSFVMKYTSYILRTLPKKKKKKLHTFRDLFCALAAAKIDT